MIEQLAARYLAIDLLRAAPGVGPVVAVTYLLTPHPARPDVFLGLRPRPHLKLQTGISNLASC